MEIKKINIKTFIKKKLNIVMLHTQEKSQLYITSDEEPKDGDWKIVKYKGQSPQIVKSKYSNSVNNLYTLEYHKKIVATTDKLVTDLNTYLPQPTKKIINLFISENKNNLWKTN
jgi:hypothetical protein